MHCVVCHKEIEPGAQKCTECDSYQNWTRYLFRYTGIITAILGIVPVVTIAVSLYEIAFTEKISDVRAVLVRCGPQKLDIGIANVGNAPAIVSNVSFRSPNTTPIGKLKIRRSGKDASPTFLVDPAAPAQILSYEAYVGETSTRFPQFPEGAAECEYLVTVETLQFDQQTHRRELRCDCPRS
jgi:predicted nucleic acid-binding Zn ribbon protein